MNYKLIFFLLILVFSVNNMFSQLDGTLTVTGDWSISVPGDVNITEAGTNYSPVESSPSQASMDWLLTPTALGQSEEGKCQGDFTEYVVFVHKERPFVLNAANDFKLFVKRTGAGFNPYPVPLTLFPKTAPVGGDSYLEIDHQSAKEFFRFQSCRRDITFQFRADLTVLTPVDNHTAEIVYTIVTAAIVNSLP